MRNLIVVLASVMVFGIFTNAQAQYQQGTQVYVNQTEISLDELTLLQSLIGPVQPGQYYLDAQGNFGVVGYQPAVNLVQVATYYAQLNQQVYNQGNAYNYYQNSGDYYRQAPNDYGIYWKEGNTSGYFNWMLNNGISSDGETHVISVDGEVLNLPPY